MEDDEGEDDAVEVCGMYRRVVLKKITSDRVVRLWAGISLIMRDVRRAERS